MTILGWFNKDNQFDELNEWNNNKYRRFLEHKDKDKDKDNKFVPLCSGNFHNEGKDLISSVLCCCETGVIN
jgi:succinate dehydrogenase flavin-adding protein (antitoxin of CptAB toxin-antitoxin module)